MLAYVIARYAPAQSIKVETLCVGLGKLGALSDPAPAMLARLKTGPYRVLPASGCKLDERSGTVRDKHSGMPAIVFNAEPAICHVSECAVPAGYQIGKLGAEGSTYLASPDGDGWKIRTDPTKPAWIS